MSNNPGGDLQSVWQDHEEEARIMTLTELQRRAQQLERSLRWRNGVEYAAAALVIAANLYNCWRFQTALLRIGSALVVAGMAYVVLQLHRRGSAGTTPREGVFGSSLDFLMGELSRQRDLLGNVWSWYLLPLFPGLTVFLLGMFGARAPSGSAAIAPAALVVTAVACVIVFALIAFVNNRAARRLQGQIESLASLKRDNHGA